MSMEIWTKVAQFFLSLSLLVILHELGHFTLAKLFKTRVEKFYLFFDPWFSLFKFKRGDTEYGVGWLPLGGYVKISGMIDESMDTEQLKSDPEPWEFRAKPTWQRLLIMIGGVVVNFLLAFVIYSMVLYTWGDEFLANKDVTYGIAVDSTAQKLGLQNGDKILNVGGVEVKNFQHIVADIVLDQADYVDVERDERVVKLPISEAMRAAMMSKQPIIAPRIPLVVDEIKKKSPAATAGLKSGDKVVGVDSLKAQYYDEFSDYVLSHKGKQVTVNVDRAGKQLAIPVTIGKDGIIGVYFDTNLEKFFHISVEHYTFWASIPAGIKKGYSVIGSYLKQLKLLASPQTGAYKSLGGFITIGKIFPGTWDWEAFWNMTGLLSIVLAIMNILPIPALDGGHVLFLLYEMVTGRKPGDKFLEYAQITGMVLLFALLLFANGNDILKLFQH
ncbi:MAG TPA: RIP metalloprotease RseP [Williamwhitmania sp.]|nr:RIP metalloprotease RseP [Williamwhitmania sp.]